MTLKQQFLDTLPLILSGHKKEDEYEIVHDIHVGICDYNMRADSMMDKVDCAICEDKEIEHCKGCLKFQADVGIENPAQDYYRYYVFGKKPVRFVENYICFINTRKQMFSALAHLKKEVDDWKNFCAEQYELHDILRAYAQQFYEDVKQTQGFAVETSILPIIFHDSCKDCKQYGTGKITMGNLHTCKKQSEINIYECCNTDIEKLKQNIRHEVLHYILWSCDLNDNDDSAAFHLLCEKYDASAYVPMPIGEKRLYNKYKKTVNLIEKSEETNKKNKIDSGVDYEHYKNMLIMSVGDRAKKSIYKNMLNQTYTLLTKPMTKEEIIKYLNKDKKAG